MLRIKSENFKTVDKSKTNITMEEEVKVPTEETVAPEVEPEAEVTAEEGAEANQE
jgi:hypothetical protein